MCSGTCCLLRYMRALVGQPWITQSLLWSYGTERLSREQCSIGVLSSTVPSRPWGGVHLHPTPMHLCFQFQSLQPQALSLFKKFGKTMETREGSRENLFFKEGHSCWLRLTGWGIREKVESKDRGLIRTPGNTPSCSPGTVPQIQSSK